MLNRILPYSTSGAIFDLSVAILNETFSLIEAVLSCLTDSYSTNHISQIKQRFGKISSRRTLTFPSRPDKLLFDMNEEIDEKGECRMESQGN